MTYRDFAEYVRLAAESREREQAESNERAGREQRTMLAAVESLQVSKPFIWRLRDGDDELRIAHRVEWLKRENPNITMEAAAQACGCSKGNFHRAVNNAAYPRLWIAWHGSDRELERGKHR